MEYADNLSKLIQVIFVDLVLAGDNALVIGLVASKFSPDYRRKIILYGMGAAVILRIIFALITIQLLQIKGVLIVGGLMLLWVCWKLWQDLRIPQHLKPEQDITGELTNQENPPFRSAIFYIVMADVSMSLDNVLAVAGIVDGHIAILVFGLTLSIAFMAIAASLIAETLQKKRWIGYIGLAIILYVAGKMLVDGYSQIQIA